MMPVEISHCPTLFRNNHAIEMNEKDITANPSVLSDIHDPIIMSDYGTSTEKEAKICSLTAHEKNTATNPLGTSNIHECFEDYQRNIGKGAPAQKEENLIVQLGSCPPSTEGFMCLGHSEQFSDNFQLGVLNRKSSNYCKKTLHELNKYSLKQLQVLVEDLTQTVEQVSSELVQLLLENDALQQESDARNIAIEQLLKMTVKVNESDLKPVQMSVILPGDDCDEM